MTQIKTMSVAPVDNSTANVKLPSDVYQNKSLLLIQHKFQTVDQVLTFGTLTIYAAESFSLKRL